MTARAGTAPYTFAVSGGTLPGGLSLSAGGVLSGVPTTASTFNFTARATDANGCLGTRAYSVIINSSNPVGRTKKGDFDGDGQTDFSVWRPGNAVWYIINSVNGAVRTQQWGLGFAPYNDQPVPGDYDGDGEMDFAVWRQADGVWHIINSLTGTIRTQQWGLNGDVPVLSVGVR